MAELKQKGGKNENYGNVADQSPSFREEAARSSECGPKKKDTSRGRKRDNCFLKTEEKIRGAKIKKITKGVERKTYSQRNNEKNVIGNTNFF